MKYWMSLIVAVLISTAVFGQSALPEKVQVQFYKAYLASNLELWESGISELEKIHQANPSDQLLLEILKAQNGMVGSCFARNNIDKASEVVKEADDLADQLLKSQPDWAIVKAIKGGLLGYKIALSPMKGMWLGSKSKKLLEKALKVDGQLPQAWYQRAMAYYQTPAAFGGDAEKAAEYFAKAVELFEKNQGCLDHNWEYLNALAWLGQAQAGTEQYASAEATYQKALAKEPLFGWVEHQLLPALKGE